MNIWKIILYLIIVTIIFFLGFYGIIIASLLGNDEFYTPFIFFGGLSLLILSLLQILKLVKNKKRMRAAWIIFFGLIVISCTVYEGLKAYDRNILRIRERNVDLSLYASFQTNTKAAILDEPATLKIEDDLPRLDGATALYPLYSAFAQAVYPKKDYHLYDSEVACNNTIYSYQSLVNKKVDIIFVAPPSTDQLNRAGEAGVELTFTPIGKEAFVFFVNARNPVENLTTEQLQAIYSGKIKNWKEVGGKNKSIRVFQRNENSGSQTAFLNFMKGQKIMEPEQEDVITEMSGIISQAADYTNYGNAIGFSFRFYAQEMVNNNDIRLLKINGVYPDLETIGNGSYPLASSFYAVTLTESTQANVPKLLDWIISAQGQSLVRKTGYCPLY